MTGPKIVFLNGPPGSGKDLAAGLLTKGSTSPRLTHKKFADPLKNALCSLLGVTREWLEVNKDQTYNFDTTYRDLLVRLSENYMKPDLGSTFLGERLTIDIKNEHDLIGTPAFIISDSGFTAEAAPIFGAFGRENCLLVRLHRSDHDFAGDSRAYWEPKDETLTCINITNDGSITEFSKTLKKEILPWLQLSQ